MPLRRPVLFVLVALCLAVHALTLTRFPAVWLDEAIFTDPAVNLAWSGHLNSTAWYFQDDGAVWAANVPLYPVLLAGWLKLLGVSAISVRAFNLLLAGLATLLLVGVAKRQAWLSSPRWTAWLAIMMLCGYGMVLAHRSMRYDVLGLLLCVAALWCITQPPPRRLPLLFGVACLIPWAGLHVAVYVGMVTLGWLLLARQRPWREAGVLLFGLMPGLLSLGAVLHQAGALEALMLNVRLSGYAGKKDGPRDPSLVLLLLAFVCIAASVAGRRALRDTPHALGWIAAGTVVPTVIYIAARFPVYYTWMAVVPLALGLAMVAGNWHEKAAASWHRRIAVVCLWGAIAIGLPVQSGITLALWHQRDPAALDAFAQRAGIAGQVVLVDPELFYAARGRAAKTYFSMYDFGLSNRSMGQREEITMMLVSPDSVPALARQLGGSWQAGELFETALPPGYGWLARRVSHSLFGGYRLQVYRRTESAGPAPALTVAGA